MVFNFLAVHDIVHKSKIQNQTRMPAEPQRMSALFQIKDINILNWKTKIQLSHETRTIWKKTQ
jgi:hypothetical protein